MRWLSCLTLLLAGCSTTHPVSTSEVDEARGRDAAQVLERAAREAGAVVTESGSVVRVLDAGHGPRPQGGGTVTIRYRTRLPDGGEIENTESRPVAPTLELAWLNPCFADGVRRMQVGGRSRVTCRSELVYGERVLPRTVVVVDLHLVDVGRPLPPMGH